MFLEYFFKMVDLKSTIFRIYVRWPDNSVTHKTTTISRAAADVAWKELLQVVWDKQEMPLGMAYTYTGPDNKKVQIDYVALNG